MMKEGRRKNVSKALSKFRKRRRRRGSLRLGIDGWMDVRIDRVNEPSLSFSVLSLLSSHSISSNANEEEKRRVVNLVMPRQLL